MKFAVSISGYGQSGAKPVTLLCALDEPTGVLVVGKEVAFKEGRLEGFSLVTNVDLAQRDFFFTVDHLRDAIRDFYAKHGQGLLAIDDEVARYSPESQIELDGIDERGPKYRLSADIGNGHVAILAAVAFVTTQKPKQELIDAMDEFAQLYSITEI